MPSSEVREFGGRQYAVEQIHERDDCDGHYSIRLYKARDLLFGRREVIIKETSALDDEKEARAALACARKEAELVALLNPSGHPGLTTLDGPPIDDTWRYCLVMKCALGRPIRELYLQPGGALPTHQSVQAILRIALQICRSLQPFHRARPPNGIRYPHRDISPNNVMVDQDRATLIDFGLAAMSIVSRQEGTAGYRAPEQTLGRPPDHTPGCYTDIYSLAAMLYHLLTRKQLPSPQHNPRFQRPPTPPSAINPAAPAALDNILLAALAYDRYSRPAINHFARLLLEQLHQLQAVSPPATSVAVPRALERGAAQPSAEDVDAAPAPAHSSTSAEAMPFHSDVPEPPPPPILPPLPSLRRIGTLPPALERARARNQVFAVVRTVVVLAVIVLTFILLSNALSNIGR